MAACTRTESEQGRSVARKKQILGARAASARYTWTHLTDVINRAGVEKLRGKDARTKVRKGPLLRPSRRRVYQVCYCSAMLAGPYPIDETGTAEIELPKQRGHYLQWSGGEWPEVHGQRTVVYCRLSGPA